MFKPARMTRVVLGGHRDHRRGVIDLLHREGVLHLEDFADPTASTDIGTPLEEGDRTAELLVRTRGMLKSLDAEEVPHKALATAQPADLLKQAETAVLPALDAAAAARGELARAESEAAALAPFEGVDIDLSTLQLRSVRSFVGTFRVDPRPALADAGVAYEASLSDGAGVILVAATDAKRAEETLSKAGFSPAQLPPGEGTPRERLAMLSFRRRELGHEVARSEAEVERLAATWGPRLAALEASLADEADRTAAPLRFRETGTTFHAEGWIPRRSANRLHNALSARFGESVYFHDLGEAPQPESHAVPPAGQTPGFGVGHEQRHGDASGGHGDAHAGGHGGHGPADEPPVQLVNRGAARPYEFLLTLLGRPRYWEIDPTKLMLIFFPLFFGLMVGDVLVGLAIVFLGLWLKSNQIFGIGGPAVGRTLVMGGVLAVIVGAFVFGEALGIHFVVDQHGIDEGEPSWECILGLSIPTEGFLHVDREAPIDCHGAHPDEVQGEAAGETSGTGGAAGSADSEGGAGGVVLHAEEAAEAEAGFFDLKPHTDEHLSLNGWVNLGYYSKIHDVKALLIWSIMIGLVHLVLGFVIGVRNVAVHHGAALAVQEKASWLILIAAAPIAIWGLTSATTWALGLGVGLVLLAIGLLWVGTAKVLGQGFVSILEVLGFTGNVLSYTRIAAIGASKAGMAIAFMAIGFDIIGGGSFHSVAGWIVYIFGMVVITLLAVLSGGLQSLRLQFVEFFQKFYTGGGRPYVPFGRRAP